MLIIVDKPEGNIYGKTAKIHSFKGILGEKVFSEKSLNFSLRESTTNNKFG